MQECPQCEKKFNLLDLRDYDDGDLRTKDFPTQGRATFCPYCGVNLNSWDAWLDKEVLIYFDGSQLDGLPVILKDTDDDYELFEVKDLDTGKVYQVDSKYVYTPN